MEEDIRRIERTVMKLESMIIDIYDAVVKEEKQCPICGNRIRLYLPHGEKLRYNCQCPICRSLARHRILWLYFQNETHLFKRGGYKLLHFAPEQVFYDKFSKMEHVDYYPVDINPEYPGIRTAVDITDIPYEGDSFDVILANRVLEHVGDDKKAMDELYRVLKKGGEAYLNVPVRIGMEKTLENPEINTPELRLRYYGQSDHVRLYGEDYKERLNEAGFKVEIINYNVNYSQDERKKYGLYPDERIYKCTK